MSTKTCPFCNGDGQDHCALCEDLGWIECECGCGDRHEATCPECQDDREDRCFACDGTGVIPLSDAELESEGQMTLLEGA